MLDPDQHSPLNNPVLKTELKRNYESPVYFMPYPLTQEAYKTPDPKSLSAPPKAACAHLSWSVSPAVLLQVRRGAAESSDLGPSPG